MDDPSPSDDHPAVDVYVAGGEFKSGVYVAKYWKNGVAVSLTDGTKVAGANSIAVAGSDVYVAGYEYNGSEYLAKYWKNGVAVSLTDGSQLAATSDIAVVRH